MEDDLHEGVHLEEPAPVLDLSTTDDDDPPPQSTTPPPSSPSPTATSAPDSEPEDDPVLQFCRIRHLIREGHLVELRHALDQISNSETTSLLLYDLLCSPFSDPRNRNRDRVFALSSSRSAESGEEEEEEGEKSVNAVSASVSVSVSVSDDWFPNSDSSPSGSSAVDDPANPTALHVACRYGHVEIVVYLLREFDWIDVNTGLLKQESLHSDGQGLIRFSPLHCAVIQGWYDVVVALLWLGEADPMLFDAEGDTCLHKVCSIQQNRWEIASALLCFQRKLVNVPNEKSGWTPLHTACFAGDHQLLKFFLLNGARIDAVSLRGWSALHVAAYREDREMMLLLLANDADPKLRNSDGRLAEFYLTERQRISLLEQYASNRRSFLDEFAEGRTVDPMPGFTEEEFEALRLLLEASVDHQPSENDRDGRLIEFRFIESSDPLESPEQFRLWIHLALASRGSLVEKIMLPMDASYPLTEVPRFPPVTEMNRFFRVASTHVRDYLYGFLPVKLRACEDLIATWTLARRWGLYGLERMMIALVDTVFVGEDLVSAARIMLGEQDFSDLFFSIVACLLKNRDRDEFILCEDSLAFVQRLEVEVAADSQIEDVVTLSPRLHSSAHLLQHFSDLYRGVEQKRVPINCFLSCFQTFSRIGAHQSVLFVRSTYFRTLLSSRFAEAQCRVLTMDEIDPRILSMLVEYIYCRRVRHMDVDTPSNVDILIQLYVQCDKYLLTRFKEDIGLRCREILRSDDRAVFELLRSQEEQRMFLVSKMTQMTDEMSNMKTQLAEILQWKASLCRSEDGGGMVQEKEGEATSHAEGAEATQN